MNEPKRIELDVVHAIHKLLILEHGGSLGIRDERLLISALTRPQNKYHYESKATLFDLAASYSLALVKNHPFVDGNKRIALTIASVFLDINKYSLNSPEPETAFVFEQLADSAIDENQLAEWFEKYSEINN